MHCVLCILYRKLGRCGDRSSCCCSLSSGRLGKVGRHVTLKIKISELITLLQLEKRSQLLVGVNLATILLVLQVVGSNVLVNLASNFSASHLRTFWLAKKAGKLVGNESGLHKTRRCTIASLALFLLRRLLSILQLAHSLTLKKTKLTAKSIPCGMSSLKLARIVRVQTQKSRGRIGRRRCNSNTSGESI